MSESKSPTKNVFKHFSIFNKKKKTKIISLYFRLHQRPHYRLLQTKMGLHLLLMMENPKSKVYFLDKMLALIL